MRALVSLPAVVTLKPHFLHCLKHNFCRKEGFKASYLQALGSKSSDHAIEQHIQWLHWLQWGVTFSQVVWLVGY